MPEEMKNDRRRFLRNAAMTLAAAELVIMGAVDAHPVKTNSATLSPGKPGTNASFTSITQIDAGLLNMGYAEGGPANGPAVILLHGWPLRHPQFCRCRSLAGREGLQSDRPVSPRLWHHPLPLQCIGSQRSAVGSRGRYHRIDGCARDPEGNHRRF
jgi:hypothetical protein